MGTKYSSQATSGYNSSPPADDGAATEANKVKWSTIKTKLADVLKTFAEAINTALVTAFDQSCRSVSADDSAAATDHNRTIQVTTSSVTITLADATTMAAGYIVSVANQSDGNITVALATSTDTIDTVTNTTQTLSTKDTRRYIVNTTATGYITASGSVVAASATVAGKVELATDAETLTGTDAARAVTPAGLASQRGLVKLNSGTVSNAATLDIVMTSYTGLANKFLVVNLIPATDGVGFYLQMSTDGGSNYDAGASNYGAEISVAGATISENSTAIRLTSDGLVGNGAAEGISASIFLYDTTSTAKWQRVSWEATYIDSAGTPVVRAPHGGGARRAAQDTDAVRLLFSSGNIASGSWTLYGYN